MWIKNQILSPAVSAAMGRAAGNLPGGMFAFIFAAGRRGAGAGRFGPENLNLCEGE
jgi:hypothetical protein